jgi:hypothetical protein
MEDDNVSVATPTPSELNMFRVMANPGFVDLRRPAPTSRTLQAVTESPEERAPSPADIFPEVHPEERIEFEQYQAAQPDAPQEVVPEVPAPEPPSKPDVFWERAKEMTEAEIVSEKEGLLLELQMLEKQGIYKPSRTLTMSDSIEELQFQVDRANSSFSAQQAVDFAKTGIRVGSLAIEKGLGRLGLGVLDGFSANLCKDMNKFNRPLTRLYRKYWRRSGGLTSPEVELLIVVLGSMLMTVVQNSNALGSFLKPKAAAPPAPAPAPAPAPPAPAAKPLIRPPVIPAASWQPVVVPSEAFANEKTVVVEKAPATAPTPRKKVVDVPIVL